MNSIDMTPVKGKDGANGTTEYAYQAFADDDSGTGWTLTETSAKKYMATVWSTVYYAIISEAEFTALTPVWVRHTANSTADPLTVIDVSSTPSVEIDITEAKRYYIIGSTSSPIIITYSGSPVIYQEVEFVYNASTTNTGATVILGVQPVAYYMTKRMTIKLIWNGVNFDVTFYLDINQSNIIYDANIAAQQIDESRLDFVVPGLSNNEMTDCIYVSPSCFTSTMLVYNGTPVQYGGAYGQITSVVAGDGLYTYTVRGAACPEGDPLTVYYFNSEKLQTETITCGAYGGGYTVDSSHGLMYELQNCKNRLLWTKSIAVLIAIDFVTKVADTGATQPELMALRYADSSWDEMLLDTVTVSTVSQDTGVTMTLSMGEYVLNYGDMIDFEITKGTNSNASGLQLILTFILT